ncbi:MAG: hypothetical protein ACHQF3_13640 [Alphaproteobacteria bacterium]
MMDKARRHRPRPLLPCFAVAGKRAHFISAILVTRHLVCAMAVSRDELRVLRYVRRT